MTANLTATVALLGTALNRHPGTQYSGTRAVDAPQNWLILVITLLALLMSQAATADLQYSVNVQPSSAGTLYVASTAADIKAEFLIDTGASMATMSESLYEQLRHSEQVTYRRDVAARLANNRLQTIAVYEIANFKVGECQLGPIEFGVIKGGSRNILGLSALSAVAPFAIGISPPVLSLSQCKGFATLAAN